MKNPYLSLWLSAANWMFATSRAHANAEWKRQARRMRSTTAKSATGLGKPARKRKSSR